MPVEINEFDDLPEWMRERLARGDAAVRIGGRDATPAEFLAALADDAGNEPPPQTRG